MSEPKIEKKDKPAEILELEDSYGIILDKINYESDDDFFHPQKDSYRLDSEGNVIALFIREKNIKDVRPIASLKDLNYLTLTRNDIEDISPLASLKKLKSLYLGGNRIKDISAIVEIKNLNSLLIWKNPILDFSPIGKLINLTDLSCHETGVEDLSFLSALNNLIDFFASRNHISDISILSSLNISRADLESNLIRSISKEIAEKYSWLRKTRSGFSINNNEINVVNNPLEFPPASVINLGKEVTKEYYNMSDEFGHAALSEGRIIIIGDGSSGKSSLIEKVLYNTFILGREQTNGIKIDDLCLQHPEDNRELNFHIWDFGGQEIQHAVHKFFFTEGCLYVLVLDNRKEEEPEYWLQQIESLGGKAPVMVVFNKQDENNIETADRKFLKEKYNNIVGFFNTSCKTGYGIEDFKKSLQREVIKLRTVSEKFPNNWLSVKKAIEEQTSGSHHYLTYEVYQEICKRNHLRTEQAQKLLLKYFNTIGTVTWFGEDVHLQFMHVLNPAWITQGVYKIITSKKTANLLGQIEVKDFKELLQPIMKDDYVYDEKHYAYILGMMKKFDLCYSPDDKHLLIPSAFGKAPKIEYSDFKGEDVRTYILQFKDYMPIALIHRFTAQKLPNVVDSNYWYTGIVIKDNKTNTEAMIHADREAKRIYIRVKGESKLGLWEHIRRDFATIASNYAKIPYDELLALDERDLYIVSYDDLISHVKAQKPVYFHPKLLKDFNVGYLMNLFEPVENTTGKILKGEIVLNENKHDIAPAEIPPVVLNILNNNNPVVNAQVNTYVNIDFDIKVVANTNSTLKGDIKYLTEILGNSNKELKEALQKMAKFTDDVKVAQNSNDIKEQGWGRKLKSILKTIGEAGEQLKNTHEGSEVIKSILSGVKNLAQQFNLHDIISWFGGK